MVSTIQSFHCPELPRSRASAVQTHQGAGLSQSIAMRVQCFHSPEFPQSSASAVQSASMVDSFHYPMLARSKASTVKNFRAPELSLSTTSIVPRACSVHTVQIVHSADLPQSKAFTVHGFRGPWFPRSMYSTVQGFHCSDCHHCCETELIKIKAPHMRVSLRSFQPSFFPCRNCAAIY